LTETPFDLLLGIKSGVVMQLSAVFAYVALFAQATLSAPAAAASSEAADGPLQAVKPWVLDYADSQCAAGRDYGDPEKPITLIIRPVPMGETYELQLIRKNAGPSSAEEGAGSVDFGAGPIAGSVLHFGSVADKLDIFQFRMATAQIQQARSASKVTFRTAHRPDATFSLTSMAALLSGLEECNKDLRRYWNVDNKTGINVTKPAGGDVRRIFTDSDYPDDALLETKEGTAQFLLFIDTGGKVAACNVLKPSGVALLDAMGCQVIRKRAKFAPARDAGGKPVRDSYVTPPVAWRISGY
jgi:TonB family protein